MNQFLSDYIERLPEPAREFARRCDEGSLVGAPEVHGLTTSDKHAIRSAVAELRQFETSPLTPEAGADTVAGL